MYIVYKRNTYLYNTIARFSPSYTKEGESCEKLIKNDDAHKYPEYKIESIHGHIAEVRESCRVVIGMP